MTEQHTLPIGTILNRKWVILEFIAKGGMGEIYRAHQLNLKRDVAIKTLSKAWLEDISEDEEEKEMAIRRFKQEVLTMAQIRHPNIIQIYDFDSAELDINGEQIAIDYIALEYIPGRTLRDTMEEEGFYPDDKKLIDWIEKYFLPVLEGVSAIHKAGIFHRDIKPENILMDGDIPKIADFGLARSCKLGSMTCSLDIKGTPNYMSPEQFIDFKRADHRTDIYALGKILYEAITGKITDKAVPFTQVGLKRDEISGLFKDLDDIIRKATHKEPEKRFQSVDELKEEIKNVILSNKNILAKGSGQRTKGEIRLSKRALALSLTLGILLFLAFVFWSFHYVREHFWENSSPKEVKIAQKFFYPIDMPNKITAPDGSTLRLIPGGKLLIQKGFPQKEIRIAPFYMDENPITNQQFVNFLNKISKRVRVENGAVKEDNEILIYLGEVIEGYDPISYEDGVFKMKMPGHAACPVIRVTGYGALEYARFYGRRLPTKTEWFYVASQGQTEFPKEFFAPLKLPTPVMLLKPNTFGIRGMNINLGSWIVEFSEPLNEVKNLKRPLISFAIAGGFDRDKEPQNYIPSIIKRQPWEGFEEVGFRCAKDI